MSGTTGKRLYVVGAVLWLLAGISVFTVDGPLARYDVSGVPGDIRRLVQLTEVFAHGTGVGLILVTLWILDGERRFFIPRVAFLAFISGIVADGCKLLVSRQRPLAFDLNSHAVESFMGIPGSLSLRDLQSFPSGHTATAFGLALGLSYLYPHGRGIFIGIAVLAALQRVLFDAHFLSDTLVTAGIACFLTGMLKDRLFWDTCQAATR